MGFKNQSLNRALSYCLRSLDRSSIAFLVSARIVTCSSPFLLSFSLFNPLLYATSYAITIVRKRVFKPFNTKLN